MQKNEFYLPSNDKIHQLHCVIWEPDEEHIFGILQLSHGMQEYVDRYDRFARFMAGNGFVVVGHDHLGHGHTVNSEDEFGYFSEDAVQNVIDDVYAVTAWVKDRYPDLPFYMLGHSMGSFILRRYLMEYGDGVDKAIIMGTGSQPWSSLIGGKVLATIVGLIKGDHYRSKLLAWLSMGGMNKHFGKRRDGKEWISSDEEITKKAYKDELGQFIFTVNGIHFLIDLVSYIQKNKHVEKIPSDLPILLISGMNDPVGHFGKDVVNVRRQMKKCGVKRVTLKLVEGNRHEVLNEFNWKENFQYIYQWILNF